MKPEILGWVFQKTSGLIPFHPFCTWSLHLERDRYNQNDIMALHHSFTRYPSAEPKSFLGKFKPYFPQETLRCGRYKATLISGLLSFWKCLSWPKSQVTHHTWEKIPESGDQVKQLKLIECVWDFFLTISLHSYKHENCTTIWWPPKQLTKNWFPSPTNPSVSGCCLPSATAQTQKHPAPFWQVWHCYTTHTRICLYICKINVLHIYMTYVDLYVK